MHAYYHIVYSIGYLYVYDMHVHAVCVRVRAHWKASAVIPSRCPTFLTGAFAPFAFVAVGFTTYACMLPYRVLYWVFVHRLQKKKELYMDAVCVCV